VFFLYFSTSDNKTASLLGVGGERERERVYLFLVSGGGGGVGTNARAGSGVAGGVGRGGRRGGGDPAAETKAEEAELPTPALALVWLLAKDCASLIISVAYQKLKVCVVICVFLF